ncbi:MULTISPECIES: nucleotide sugar dehydrogenase [unclassified Streptomyces]|uniref:nucleotide sugar dehydrogenase n=1 Tax=unclassified Streptomyces TaxID=2593676 RepID=UPI0004C0B4C7|nr:MULTISPECIES: nucleotide sugar dehydrogenase [unclassified Streptomyces]
METVAVVGLGYTGLPLAREACAAGMRVVGLDENPVVTAALESGRSHVPDVTDADLARMAAAGFTATTDAGLLAEATAAVICVPTPLDDAGEPDLSHVRRAASAVGAHLKPGTLVVLESTSYPGTTDGVVRALLEEASGLTAGTDFALAFSPERIDPGNGRFGIRNTPRVVGGCTASCTAAAAGFFRQLCDRVVEAGSAREAELAKLLENVYRSVNIALVNELAVAGRALGVDVWDALDCAASKPFGYQQFRPGPGVGGHCIPVDPAYLTHWARTAGRPLHLVELAQRVNAAMPAHVVHRAGELLHGAGKELGGARLLLVGVTYKRDSRDLRCTPATPLTRLLRQAGAHVRYHDPLADAWTVDGEPVPSAARLREAAAEADLTILLQDHGVLPVERLPGWAPLLLDTRGRLRDGTAHVL